jgi:hypothetical protein
LNPNQHQQQQQQQQQEEEEQHHHQQTQYPPSDISTAAHTLTRTCNQGPRGGAAAATAELSRGGAAIRSLRPRRQPRGRGAGRQKRRRKRQRARRRPRG